MQRQATAVVFGAGSVGRGFLGQLFSESGYEVVFVDVDDALVDALRQQGYYALRLAGIDAVRELTIGPVRAIDGRDVEQVAREVSRAALMATAVGARALSIIAKTIAVGLAERWQAGRLEPLNVIICENLHDAPDLLRGYVREALPEVHLPHLDTVGFVPAVIARMSPVPTSEQRASDVSLIVAEPYKVLPVDREAFVGEIPEIVGMEPVAPFSAYVERKLYIHNAAHAILGYLGYRRGHQYGYEALADAHVKMVLNRALDESSRALVAEHGLDPGAIQAHVQDLLARFANRALADPIDRLARDPLRKLRPDDRLVGAARLAERHGVEPTGLATGIAAALAYDNPGDEHAVKLQQRLADRGLDAVLDTVCHIEEGEHLGTLIRERYRMLREDPTW
jgi:mannitol-1-phosphate 5-dehydrogenase